MRVKYLCVLVRVWVGGGVGADRPVWGLRWGVLLSVPGRCFFWESFMFFPVLCSLCLCERLFICALSSPSGKGLISWLSFVVSNCEFVTFPLVSWVRCGT